MHIKIPERNQSKVPFVPFRSIWVPTKSSGSPRRALWPVSRLHVQFSVSGSRNYLHLEQSERETHTHTHLHGLTWRSECWKQSASLAVMQHSSNVSRATAKTDSCLRIHIHSRSLTHTHTREDLETNKKMVPPGD